MNPPHPHDLLHVLPQPDSFTFSDSAEPASAEPDSAQPAFAQLGTTPFVVVRRACTVDGRVPVGVRGPQRAQRYAAWLCPRAILRTIQPAELRTLPATRALPAFDALRHLEDRWHTVPFAWGPTGSVGFELASGAHAVTPTSDLDVQLRIDSPLDRQEARRLLNDTHGLPAQVDIQVETPHGAFLLAEYARSEAPCLLRTVRGPVLVRNPWSPPELTP